MPSAAETWVAPGARVGAIVAVGKGVGVAVGKAVDVAVGKAVDVVVGMIVGVAVGMAVSVVVGMVVGMAVGMTVHVAGAMVEICPTEGPQPETMTLTRIRMVKKRCFWFIFISFNSLVFRSS
jgi:hypothetical protein